MPPAPQARKSGLLWKIKIAVVGVLAIAAGVVGAIAISTNAAAAEAMASASRSAEARATAEASKKAAQAKANRELDQSIKDLAAAAAKSLADAAKQDRAAMEENDWTYVSDYLYYAKAPGEYRCPDRYRCAAIIVTNNKLPDGCLGGMSVSVSFISSTGVSVYNSVRNTGALATGEQAQLEILDLSGNGSTFRVDSMRCH